VPAATAGGRVSTAATASVVVLEAVKVYDVGVGGGARDGGGAAAVDVDDVVVAL